MHSFWSLRIILFTVYGIKDIGNFVSYNVRKVGNYSKALAFYICDKNRKNVMLIVKYMVAGSRDILQEPMLCNIYVSPDSISQLQSMDQFTITYSCLGTGSAKLNLEKHINLFWFKIFANIFQDHPSRILGATVV